MTRPLSGTERAWLVGARLVPPFAISIAVDFDGEAPSLSALHQAAAALAELRPDTRLRLRGSLGGARWFPEGPALAVLLLSDDPDALQRHDPEELQQLQPLDPESGPGLGVLVRVSGGRWRLHLRGCHAVVDGRGLMAILEDLLALLRGDPVEPVALGPTDQELLARHAALSAPELPRPTDPPASPFGTPPPSMGRGLIHIVRRVPATRRPLQAVLAGLTAAAESAGVDPAELRVAIPVDLRRHQEGGGRLGGNLTGMLHRSGEQLRPGERLDLRGAVDAGEHLAVIPSWSQLRPWPTWLVTFLARMSLHNELKRGRPGDSATVSNLGRVPLDGLHLPRARATGRHWLPPGGEGLPLFLGLMGDDDSLELGASISRRWASQATAEAFMDSLVDGLTER